MNQKGENTFSILSTDYLSEKEIKMYCECGCGKLVPIAKRTNSGKGHVKGQPVRFYPNHNSRACKTSLYKSSGRWWVYNRGGGKTLWSRVVFQNYYLGGEEIPSGMFVHHKDENIENDLTENLEIKTRKDHVKHHKGMLTVLKKDGEVLQFSSSNDAGLFLNRTGNAVLWAIKNDKEIERWSISHSNEKKAIPPGKFIRNEKFYSLDEYKGKTHDYKRKKKITVLEKDGERIEFSSGMKAAKFIGVSSASVSAAALKKTLTRGYRVYYIQK
jgi:hypothetical protein